jgi:hypothetical protein
MTKKDKVMLHRRERNTLRNVYGVVTMQGVQRSRSNQELISYKNPYVVVNIKRRRVE